MATDQRPRSLADIGNRPARESRADSAHGHALRANRNGGNGSNGSNGGSGATSARSSTAIGWDIYRGLTDNNAADGPRRQGAAKLYTLKAYKAWAAKVRANWDAES